jgi:hypothetical protein
MKRIIIEAKGQKILSDFESPSKQSQIVKIRIMDFENGNFSFEIPKEKFDKLIDLYLTYQK